MGSVCVCVCVCVCVSPRSSKNYCKDFHVNLSGGQVPLR